MVSMITAMGISMRPTPSLDKAAMGTTLTYALMECSSVRMALFSVATTRHPTMKPATALMMTATD
jgi:hypothetical protein